MTRQAFTDEEIAVDDARHAALAEELNNQAPGLFEFREAPALGAVVKFYDGDGRYVAEAPEGSEFEDAAAEGLPDSALQYEGLYSSPDLDDPSRRVVGKLWVPR